MVLTLGGTGLGTTVFAGSVLVPSAPTGATTVAAGRLVIRQDRTHPIDTSAFKWHVSARAPVTPVNVDSRVKATFAPLVFDPATKTYDTHATLTNNSIGILRAPITLVITSGLSLTNATGVTSAGLPYVSVAAVANRLAPSDSVDVLLKFSGQGAVSGSIFAVIAPAPGNAMSPQERSSSLQALHEFMSLLDGADTATDSQTIVQFLQFRPEFLEAGISDGGLTVWARWNDGVEYMFVRNLTPPTSSGASTSSSRSSQDSLESAPHLSVDLAARLRSTIASPSPFNGWPENGHPPNLPASSQIRLLDAMGPGWETADVRPVLRELLEIGQNYEEIAADASVQSLRGVAGDAVFYFFTHGGTGEGAADYALWTATQRSELLDNDTKIKADLAAKNLIHYEACFDNTLPCPTRGPVPTVNGYEDHYAITDRFIDAYWSNFSQNSLVYMDICDSMSDSAQRLRAAMRSKHASLILGWPAHARSEDSAPTAKFVFDRLVGANSSIAPERAITGFNQRPFDWISVLNIDCAAHSMCSSEGTKLTKEESVSPSCSAAAFGGCFAEFGLLAPSIRQLQVEEEVNQLLIYGLFGADPGPLHRSVSIGGKSIPIVAWSGYVIATSLPPGAVGDVIVSVNNHTSNVAQLTEWRASFTMSLTDLQQLRQTMKLNVHFRGDVRRTRRFIHEAPEPVQPPIPSFVGYPLATLESDSSVPLWTCGGNATVHFGDMTVSETWNGSGHMVMTGQVGVDDNATQEQPDLSVDMLPHVMTAVCPDTVVITQPDEPTSTEHVATGIVVPEEAAPPPVNVLVRLYDNGTMIGGGTIPNKIGTLSVAAAGFVGSPKASVVISWPTTSPTGGTGPDPNGAR
jgi:hypothetical protein